MIVKRIPVGMLQTNCYILVDEKSNNGVIIDPGGDADVIIKIINDNNWDIQYILITHGHYDHIMDVDKIKKSIDVPIVIHEDEVKYLTNQELNLSSKMMVKPIFIKQDKTVKENEEIVFGNKVLRVIKVPGHTQASVCYFEPKEKILISGDTLFKYSIGRTDFYNGNPMDLINNIKEKLLILPEDTVVYPGHGEPTTIKYEKNNNPYLNDDFWEI